MQGGGNSGKGGDQETNYPKAQSRPEDKAPARQQQRTAWIIAIGGLVAFVIVTSLFLR